jgi:hypothetical protein
MTGCTIGPQTVYDFTFSVVSGSGSATDTNIFVTPTFGVNFYGVQFASSDFTTGAGTVSYLIGFNWDSIPIVGMGDALDPGNVNILTDGCVGAVFVGSSCSGTAVNVTVDPTQLTDSMMFSSTAILGIANNISLNANGSFNSIEDDAYVTPEPASFLLAALGVTIVILRKPRITATDD